MFHQLVNAVIFNDEKDIDNRQKKKQNLKVLELLFCQIPIKK